MTDLEHVGSLYCENQRLLGEYRKLLALVQQIKGGDVKPEAVRVDLEKLTWAIEVTPSEFQEMVAK
jgi:hypothetical protein